VTDIYGGSAWEMEAPLDLGGYAMDEPSTTNSTGQTVGKIMALLVVGVVCLLAFVMYRSGWQLSIVDLPKQVAFAFSNKPRDVLPPEVEELEVTVDSHELVTRRKGGPLLVVNGTVYNNGKIKLANIVLRGRLYDSAGDMRGQVLVPCNKLFENGRLKKVREGEAALLYRKKGVMHDCAISAESSTLYQLIFEPVPADFDRSFEIEVKPSGARPSS